MYAGRVAEEGPVNRVFTSPRHPYTQKLLSSFPNIRADRRTLDVIPGQPPDLRDPPPGCRFAPRCPFVMDVCREVVPPEVRFADGVRVACHLYPNADAPMAGQLVPLAVVGVGAGVGAVSPASASAGPLPPSAAFAPPSAGSAPGGLP
jgi:oligopeptide/dipeptide ABC transporter ATP-binding protein